LPASHKARNRHENPALRSPTRKAIDLERKRLKRSPGDHLAGETARSKPAIGDTPGASF
jgi:hypothetical protein